MKSLSERDKEVIWHPYTQMKTADPSVGIVRGEGAYLFDEQGNKYIDAVSSWWTNLHGHAHPYIAEKVSKQLATLEHVIFAGFTHEPAIELAERLLRHLPSNQKRIFYSDNGSTAVEVALKMAFQYWHNKGEKRTKVIAFENAYHGDTFGAMSVSGRSIFTKPYDNLLFDVIHIPVPVKGKEAEAIDNLKSKISNLKSLISSFIFEPLIQGTAGMIMYDAGALNEMISICHDNNILTIADEVMTGFGRTGKFFATDFIHEKPDIVCMSKGITGGTMAFGVTSCTNNVYEAFLSEDKMKTLFHGHSYTANPVACAAALASLDLMEKQETLDNIQRISRQHLQFQKGISDLAAIKDCRVCGTVLAVEINTKNESSYLNAVRDVLYKFFIDEKVILRPLGNIVYVLPPYCISNEDLQIIYDLIRKAIDTFGVSK